MNKNNFHAVALAIAIASSPFMADTARAQGGNEAVGTPSGALTVSDMGAAVYSLNFEVPDGGPLTPQVGIAYNSQQAGYGLAGYGFNITGISCITRGGKDMFHDGTLQGVTYTANDNFYLDGKRLILKEGTHGEDGSKYCLEGDPYTEVLMHNRVKTIFFVHDPGSGDEYFEDKIPYYVPDSLVSRTEEIIFWFEVSMSDGRKLSYGSTPDSKLMYTNTSGLQHISSWYITRIRDIHSNYVTYEYTSNNLVIYPKTIKYGVNGNKSGGFENRIEFSYDGLGENFRTFRLEDRQGKIDVCLSSVTTSSNGKMYRKYTLGYDNTSDSTEGKWTRLTSVTEENGQGEKLRPVKFDWEFLPNANIAVLQADIHKKIVDEKELNSQFFAADLNGDGISDIVELVQFQKLDGTGSYYTKVHLNQSEMARNGEIWFNHSWDFTMSPMFDNSELNTTILHKSLNGGSSAIDIDGNGFNDLVLMRRHYSKSGKYVDSYVSLNIFYGGGHLGQLAQDTIEVDLSENNCDILNVTFDGNGDGKDEIFIVEDRKKDGAFPCVIVQCNREPLRLSFNLPNNPKRLFLGDYNNDGLQDLLILHDDGYKIYYNNGGNDLSHVFAENNTRTGFNVRNFWRIEQGDFDGDGLADFVYSVDGEKCLRIAHNNGNGTFSISQTADFVGNQKGQEDNDKFSIKVCDIDHDGRSDVMICKAMIKDYKYSYTAVLWLLSDGKTLKQHNRFEKKRKADTFESNFFLGDFDGDGYVELANYGSSLLSTDDTFDESKINVYKLGGELSQIGKIIRITDSFDNVNQIRYGYLTDPKLYSLRRITLSRDGTKVIETKENGLLEIRDASEFQLFQYPVNSYTLPLSVVANVTSDNGVCGSQTENYSYEDLKIHIAGRGMLGFGKVTKENTLLGTKETTSVIDWDKKRWLPLETVQTSTIGDSTSTVTSTFTIADYKFPNGDSTYFSYVSQTDIKDLDGNKSSTYTQYDIKKGVILSQTVENDGQNMFKKVEYAGYEKKACGWLPASMTRTQKHQDDPALFSNRTRYKYDNLGNVTQKIENSGTHWELKTDYTYDGFGNVKSSVSSGWEVIEVTDRYEYDNTGRYLIKHYTEPESTVTLYTYDEWGNLLKQTDVTNPSNPLSVTNTYDGWGRLKSSLSADGLMTRHETGWESFGDSDRKYYTRVMADGQAPVTTWYDKAGHEVYEETTGRNGVRISQTTLYDDKGRVSWVQNKVGELATSQSYTYDKRGRVVLEEHSSGKKITRRYDNRTVETTAGNQTRTVTTDVWGNVVKSKDASGEVIYKYHSCGKPSSVQSHGSEVTMQYDEVGNQITMVDPDAGEMSYDYAADGTLMTQQDARGVMTTNTFDELGRLSQVEIGVGGQVVHYTYGTSGNEKMQLVKQSMDGCSIEYTHDKFGRVIKEHRKINGWREFITTYEYDDKGQLAEVHYPGGLDVAYEYDDYGFMTNMYANGEEVYCSYSYDGLTRTSYHLGKLQSISTWNEQGYLSNRKVKRGTNELETLSLSYDVQNDNLLSRQRNDGLAENFTYDNLDRLVSVSTGIVQSMRMDYAANGNLLSKTGVGDFHYSGTRPHAVTCIDNVKKTSVSEDLLTEFNALGKIARIEKESANEFVEFTYGPDLQRWYTSLSNEYKPDYKTIFFAGNYEEVIIENQTTGFYFLGHNIIVVKKNGKFTPYLAFTDNLGSILSVMDEDGTKVFDASYDAWGKQTVKLNTIGFPRGYTGHEMLNEFGIINMNGRLYDPELGRFFSPDNYVQAPTNSQNFNRYSYCLNNPLKYTDPSGEFWEMFVASVVMCAIQYGAQEDMNGGNFWNGAWKGALVGATSSALGAGAGSLITGSGAIAGFLSGAVGGAVGGFTASVGNAWASGHWHGVLKNAGKSAAIGASIGGLIGGINGGVNAKEQDGNFWTGAQKRPQDVLENVVETDDVIQSYSKEEPVSYSTENVKTFSQKNIGRIKHVSRLYADGTLPPPDPETGAEYGTGFGGYVYNTKGEPVSGSTRYLGFGKGSEIYIYQTACRTPTKLYFVLKHEYMHAYFNHWGINGKTNWSHREIYKWEKFQAKAWNYNAQAYSNRYEALLNSWEGPNPHLWLYGSEWNKLSQVLPVRPWAIP